MSDEDRLENLRKEVTGADDTGMIASEQFAAEAETRPVVPHEDLHAALPREHPAHSIIDALHAEMRSPSPDRRKIEAHVGQLRGIPELEATIVSWWEKPAVQRVIGNLGQIGL
jgi:hypothetical protein